MKRLDELKGFVKMMLIGKDEKPLDQLVTIDLLQRLGVSYHFEDEIKSILDCRYKNYDRNNMWKVENLYATAVELRLLRQHGHNVPQDVFNCFKDEMGRFKPCHYEDIKGTLCLYEASYFSMEGESVLDEARDFTKKHLEKSLEQSIDKNLAILVSHSLELPLHWRMLRIEARWFIDVHERRQDMDPSLLEFAKVDYNMVQAIHQEDLKDVSKWWKNIGLGEKMSFTRDRLVENFLWAVGHAFEPQFGYCRKIITKVLALIVTIDDIYDIYGTLDELEIFTDAVDRWDINAMDQLPEYMKICFLALFNSVNEMAYNVLKEEGSNIIPHLRKMDELKRGDVPKSIQCHMHQTGASQEEACEHIKYLIGDSWKKMNKEQSMDSPFSRIFIRIAMNVGRMGQRAYLYGDGYGVQDRETKEDILLTLIEPVPHNLHTKVC